MLDFISSKFIFGLLVGLASVIILLAVFAGGVAIGERKARHLVGWSENYQQMLDHTRRDFHPPSPLEPFMLPGGHGVFGKVLSVTGSTLVVQGKDNVEQQVLVTSSTVLRVGRSEGALTDIHPDTDVAIFGAPNGHGQIEARLIRLLTQP